MTELNASLENLKKLIKIDFKPLKQSQKEAAMFGNPIVPSVGLDWGYSVQKYQEVKITKAHNGFIVKVGCVTFVETSWKKICKALEEYWNDPVKAEKKYYKKQ